MAQSRLEKIGTIYSRITSLLRGGAVKQEETPLWLAVYEAFPPKYEPKFDRQLPSKPVTAIFYKEDVVRAKLHKDKDFLSATDLGREDIKTATQDFLFIYKTIQKETGSSADNAFEQAMLRYKSEVQRNIESRKMKNELSKPV